MHFPHYGFVRTVARRFFPSLIWSIDSQDSIFLTFDDGPCPHVTPWILDTLKKHNAKATFFCIGKNAEQYPELLERIREEGHAIGNHTYSHTKALLSSCGGYIEDVDLANNFVQSNLFRPPYGRMSPAKIRRMRERYHIIMWDTVSRDYSKYVSHHKCVREVVPHLRAGGIVAFHDSLKASRNVRYALPRVLDTIDKLGLKCSAIKL
ncbi:MAG: polysaccharide deacetylase family protein [Rikenellaceae bacterium]